MPSTSSSGSRTTSPQNIQDDNDVFRLKPIKGIVQPPVKSTPSHPGRVTNQLRFLKNVVFKAVWEHGYSWPFQKPVDAIKMKIPVIIVK